MDAQPYSNLSDLSLMALCCYREARGEPFDGKRGVCHVISNRAAKPGWWGHDIASVILKPYQFSSFNGNDPNMEVWPKDIDPAYTESLSAAAATLFGDDPDLTEGATYYHDLSIGWPRAWGNQAIYRNTLNVGRLKFYKLEGEN